ncbi:MAG TPA: DUF1778 domain-containing protein [bacterium]|nr:DUF1778 domain-containing protein [bacterium]
MTLAIRDRKTNGETLNLRIKAELGRLIDRAADLSGRSRTDFVLEAARHAAFLERLDTPPRPNGRLRRSLRTTALWEK